MEAKKNHKVKKKTPKNSLIGSESYFSFFFSLQRNKKVLNCILYGKKQAIRWNEEKQMKISKRAFDFKTFISSFCANIFTSLFNIWDEKLNSTYKRVKWEVKTSKNYEKIFSWGFISKLSVIVPLVYFADEQITLIPF